MKNIIILLINFFTITTVLATPSLETLFIAEYPFLRATKLDSCSTCHMPIVSDSLNSYGLALKNVRENGEIDFKATEGLDSDGDTKSNLDELKNKSAPGSQADQAEYFVFTNTKGRVHFNHETHVASKSYLSAGVCGNCHATKDSNVTDLFQKKFDDSISLRTEAHKICLGCHKTSGNEGAPVKCGDCHLPNQT